jgi:hypothetical protein
MKTKSAIFLIITILYSCGSQNSSTKEKEITSSQIPNYSNVSNDSSNDTSAFVNKNYGIGKIRILFENIGSIKRFTYFLYSQPSLDSEKKEMTLIWNENNNGYVEALNDDKIKIRDYHIDEPYYIILFDCLREKEGFYQIVTNENSRETKWIHASETVIFEPWSVFLQNVVCITQIDTLNNPVRKDPHVNSEILSNSDGCWKVEIVNEHWVKVKYSDIDFDFSDPKIRDFQGWIRWRDNNNFLISYFLAI